MSTNTEYSKPEIKTDFGNTPIIVYFIIALVLYLFGFYATLDFIFDPSNTIFLDEISNGFTSALNLSLGFLPFILVFGLIFLVITVILAYYLLWIISKTAQKVTIFVAIAFPIILILTGILITILGQLTIGLILVVIGVVLELFVAWKFQVIKRSGKFVEFSAKLVLDEKAVLGMPIILGVFSVITGFFMLFGFIKIMDLFAVQNGSTGSSLEPAGIIIALLFEYMFIIVYLGLYYSLSAGVISYASDWYRGLDPDLNTALKDVRQVLAIILKFAFMMATVKMIMQLARGEDNRDNTFVTFFISIIGGIWLFLNYFTLVSIVQNKKGLKDSIKDSATTTWKALMDVLVGETGFGLTMIIFAFINAFIWIITGFGIGLVIFPNGIGQISQISISASFSVIFLIIGFLPYFIVTMPMKVAFTTFIYSYATDTVDGFNKPSRLPEELRDEFKTLARADKKRHGRDPAKYF